MAKIDWKNMDDTILDAIKRLKEKGFDEPTVRSVYYVLGSENVVPLTDYGYKALDAKMVTMRREGLIPWGFFAVKRGRTIDVHGYYTSDVWANHFIKALKTAHDTYHLPRWFSQEHLVEVWVEKDGLLGATANWLSDLEVTCRAPQGQGAWEFIHDAMKAIDRELEAQEKEQVHIIYLGDLDPSGMRIPEVMQREGIPYFEEHFGMDEIDFQVIGVTPEQVEQYNLPDMPESEDVLAKIRRDPNMNWYRERYPEVFTELDSFYALATDEAQDTLIGAVEQFFDEDKFEATREQEQANKDDVKAIVDSKVTFKEE